MADEKRFTMDRRDFIRLAGLGAAGAMIPTGWLRAAEESASGRRPNILIIVSDDQGYADLGVQGCKDVPTPNIDSLAKNGVRFTDGHVSCPVCSPSRAGLVTGRYQERFGHEFNPGDAQFTPGTTFGLPLTEVTLADRLKNAGYKTGLVGKWHLGTRPDYYPTRRGFDEFFGFLGGAHKYLNNTKAEAQPIMRGEKPIDEPEYLTDAFGREGAAFIDRHKNEAFFLQMTFNSIHTPQQVTEKYLKRFQDIKDIKRKRMAAMLSAMDDAVGLVLKRLREHGLEENTLIFYFSDNGGPTPGNASSNAPLTGYKGQVWEGGIRIPFLMQWKGHIQAGQVYNLPIISLDIHPTALAAAGVHPNIPKEKALDGVNLLPFLKGDNKNAPHEYLFWRYGKQHAVRKGDYKLVRIDDKDQLFDLSTDIGEKKDLSSEKPEMVEQLASALEKWESELKDPLWASRAKAKGKAKAKKNSLKKRQRKAAPANPGI